MKIVAGNWKMNPESLKKARSIFNFIKSKVKKIKNVKVIIFPPFIYLPYFLKFKLPSNLSLGAQNCFIEEKGAFTGEISPLMLKNLKTEYVILGHSERREHFKETDEIINKKLKACLKLKLKPILCIGEKRKERKKGKTLKVLRFQIQKALYSIEHLASNIIFAYEPVWAIGTGIYCEPEDAKKVLIFLREILKESKILYGGSVNSKIAKDYIFLGFDGLLVGGASLKKNEFLKIIESCQKNEN